MYSKSRFLVTTLVAVLLFSSASIPALAGGQYQDLPEDLVRVLPDNFHILLTAPSVEAINEAVRPFTSFLDMEEGEEFDFKVLLEGTINDGARLIDPTKPLAVTFMIPNMMGGEKEVLTLAVPLALDTDEIDALIADQPALPGEMEPRFRQGKYVAFANVAVSGPGKGTSALVQDLPAGSMVASLDLAKIVADFRPLIEMGLGMAAMSVGAAPADSNSAVPQVSPDEIAAGTSFLMALMDSGLRYDSVMEAGDDELVIYSNLKIRPDSPLSSGPQPDFQEALKLTRILPGGGDFLAAIAWDYTPFLDYFLTYYQASMAKLTAEMDPEIAADFMSWFEAYTEKLYLYQQPMAASMNFVKDSIHVNTVIKCEEMDVAMADVIALIETSPGESLGYEFEALPALKIDGTEVRRWKLNYDPTTMMEAMTGFLPNEQDEGLMSQMAETNDIINKIIPEILLAGRGDYLFFSTGSNGDSLQKMFANSKMRRGGIDGYTARTAKAAGPDCRELVIIDAMAMITWSVEMMEEVAQATGEMDENDDFQVPTGQPILFSTTMSSGPELFSQRSRIKTSDLLRLIDVIQELEEYFDALEEEEEVIPSE